MKVPKKNKISKLCKIKNTTFEGSNSVMKFTQLLNSSIGYGSYISSYSKIFNCKIGKYCSIAQKVQIVHGKHPVKDFVSTNPSFYSSNTPTGLSFRNYDSFEENTFLDSKKKWLVEIGNDVWIGYGALIMEGVTIGNGAVIAAGAVVSKNVAPYMIVGGVPAIEIRPRFPKEKILILEKFKWWDKNLEWIEKNINSFDNIDDFVKMIQNEESEIYE